MHWFFFRYLASGNSFKSMGYSYRNSPRAISRSVMQVCEALWRQLKGAVMPEPTKDQLIGVANDFSSKWNFNNCMGAIDGKHVHIKAPPRFGSDYFNYKGRFSTVLLAIADSHMRFIYVDVGAKGRFSDGGIFASSLMSTRLKDSRCLPEDKPLYEGGKPMPFTVVGDSAFPLMTHLMRSYPGKKARGDRAKRVFNYRLSRARRVVESAFGILASRWKVYERPFEIPVYKVDKVVLASVVLHNFLTKPGNIGFDMLSDEETDNIVARCFSSLRTSNAQAKRASFAIRDDFKDFFMSPSGDVPWQWDYCEHCGTIHETFFYFIIILLLILHSSQHTLKMYVLQC